MSPFLVSFFNSIIFVIYCYLGSYIILQKNHSGFKKITIAVIYLLIMYYVALCIMESLYAIFFSGLSAFLFIKLIFQESIYMSLFISLILNAIKIVFKIIILLIINNDNYLLLNTYKTIGLPDFYINVASMGLSIILIFLLRKILCKIIKYLFNLKNKKIVLLIAVYFSFLFISLFQPPFEKLTLEAITDIIIIIGVTGIGILSISSEMKTETLIKHYQDIYECSKANAELLNEYKMQVHENKNRLLMIKGMLDNKDKKVIEYVDSLLIDIKECKESTNYWLTELQYIPLPGIRNFINYKLIKLKELGTRIEIFVSSELNCIDPSFLNNKEYNQLTTILGVVLDNMIESIKETEEKLISVNIYIEDDKIHAEFVNTFSGKIDLNRLNEVGYTTKDEQHGFGLPLVDKIVKTNKRFECYPQIIDNFFTQNILIKICNKNNLQKISKN